MRNLKLATARDTLVFLADSADHVSGKTGLTLTITASKNAAAFASITPTVTERGTGWYALALTSSHTDTLGDFALHITATGADPADVLAQVVVDLPGTAQTGDSFARIGVNGAGLTALGDARLANLDSAVSTRLAGASYTAPDNADIVIAAAAAVSAATDTSSILARLGAFTGSGVNTVLGFFKALFKKDASTPSDVGGTFDPATDSTEAIRDRGDVAWITASGSDWTSGERQQIRYALGITGTSTATTGAGILDLVYGVVSSAGGIVEIGAIVPPDGTTINIVQGDSYYNSESRSLRWSSTTTLNLATALVEFKVYNAGAQSTGLLTTSTMVVTGSSGGWIIYAELSAVQTTLMNISQHAWEIVVTLANDHVVTLTEGTLNVTP